jgi:hypothetical protein
MSTLVERLAVSFGEPTHSPEPEKYIAEVARLTKAYTASEHARAADLLIRSYRPSAMRPWPSISEICMACADARDENLPRQPAPDRHPEWSPRAVAKAYDLIRSPLGMKAADEGWILSLWDHCRKTGKLPSPNEAMRCQANARSFDDAYSLASKGGGVARSLMQLGDTMLRRRDRLARHAHGEDVPREEFTEATA